MFTNKKIKELEEDIKRLRDEITEMSFEIYQLQKSVFPPDNSRLIIGSQADTKISKIDKIEQYLGIQWKEENIKGYKKINK